MPPGGVALDEPANDIFAGRRARWRTNIELEPKVRVLRALRARQPEVVVGEDGAVLHAARPPDGALDQKSLLDFLDSRGLKFHFKS